MYNFDRLYINYICNYDKTNLSVSKNYLASLNYLLLLWIQKETTSARVHRASYSLQISVFCLFFLTYPDESNRSLTLPNACIIYFLCVVFYFSCNTGEYLYRLSPAPFAIPETSNSETYERSCYYEVVENTKDQPSRSGSVRSRRSLVWPPPKPIEDITYPTASPLYINPNPILDKKCHQIKEKRASIEACERALSRRTERHRSESIDREVERVLRENGCRHETDAMDRISCPRQPVYRRVELVDTNSRTSRSNMTTSRPSSTDSVRRSLTPTKIVQPIPKPWTATVSSGGSNLYQQSYAVSAQQEQPVGQMYKKFMQREVCHQERISGGKEYREEQRAYKTEICKITT